MLKYVLVSFRLVDRTKDYTSNVLLPALVDVSKFLIFLFGVNKYGFYLEFIVCRDFSLDYDLASFCGDTAVWKRSNFGDEKTMFRR